MARAMAEPETTPTPSSIGQVDRTIGELEQGAARWAELDADERADLLDRCIDHCWKAAPEWVAQAVAYKGPLAAETLSGEEWLSGPASTIRGLRLRPLSTEKKKGTEIPSAATRGSMIPALWSQVSQSSYIGACAMGRS